MIVGNTSALDIEVIYNLKLVLGTSFDPFLLLNGRVKRSGSVREIEVIPELALPRS